MSAAIIGMLGKLLGGAVTTAEAAQVAQVVSTITEFQRGSKPPPPLPHSTVSSVNPPRAPWDDSWNPKQHVSFAGGSQYKGLAPLPHPPLTPVVARGGTMGMLPRLGTPLSEQNMMFAANYTGSMLAASDPSGGQAMGSVLADVVGELSGPVAKVTDGFAALAQLDFYGAMKSFKESISDVIGTMIALPIKSQAWAEAILHSTYAIGQFSGDIQATRQMQEVRQIERNLAVSSELATPSRDLMNSLEDLRDDLEPVLTDLKVLLTRLVQAAVDLSRIGTGIVSNMPLLSQLLEWLSKLAEILRGETGDTDTVFNRMFNEINAGATLNGEPVSHHVRSARPVWE